MNRFLAAILTFVNLPSTHSHAGNVRMYVCTSTGDPQKPKWAVRDCFLPAVQKKN